MKKVILLLIAMIGLSSVSYAQMTAKQLKKATKEAQAVVKKAKDELMSPTGNLKTARSLIEQAMTNELTINKSETWSVAGDIFKVLYLNENQKAYQNVAFDTVSMYNYLNKMYEYYILCDSLEQIPNDKGKTSMSCREKNAMELDRNRSNFINGGIFYFNNRKDFAKAFKMFEKYYEMGNVPMLKPYNDADPNSASYAIEYAYYPTLAAYQLQDYENVLKYVDLGMQDSLRGEDCLWIKTESYEQLKDTTNWIETLQEGVVKYPANSYFFDRLIAYYYTTEQMDKLEKFAQKMIEDNPDKAYSYYVIGYLRQEQKNLEAAIEAYKTAIEKDPELKEAHINLGLCYLLQANNFMESKSDLRMNSNAYKKALDDEKIYYNQARPIFEKVRVLAPEDIKKWGLQLYQIYYKLNLAKELNEIETTLKSEGLL